ncbi:MAG: hypothetical protein K2L64_02405, partial [Ureaplasma sp.]|nr:hypothetical protein [Ureaplasma sp.]
SDPSINNIYNVFNNIILNQKYTSEQFANYFNENIESIKQIVVKSLYISNTNTIDPDLIETIDFKNNQVKITFKTGNLSYNLVSNIPNVSLNENIMSISNFTFYKSITIDSGKLNTLKASIQNYINKSDNQFTKEEFNTQVNSLTFKNEVATQLGILSSEINNISYSNNTLTIYPNNLTKFESLSVNNNYIVDNSIQVSNFDFYQSQTITQTEKLFLALKTYILNNKLTSEEFKQKVAEKDKDITKIIQDNLLISTPNENNPDEETTSPIDTNQIISYSFDNNQLSIQLDTNYLKYNLLSSNNVVYNDGTITIKNLEFYTAVEIDDTKLNELHKNIQSLIDTNQYTEETFKTEYLKSTFKSQIATYLGILTSNINRITFANNVLEVT